jgi:hypothetical protein
VLWAAPPVEYGDSRNRDHTSFTSRDICFRILAPFGKRVFKGIAIVEVLRSALIEARKRGER